VDPELLDLYFQKKIKIGDCVHSQFIAGSEPGPAPGQIPALLSSITRYDIRLYTRAGRNGHPLLLYMPDFQEKLGIWNFMKYIYIS